MRVLSAVFGEIGSLLSLYDLESKIGQLVLDGFRLDETPPEHVVHLLQELVLIRPELERDAVAALKLPGNRFEKFVLLNAGDRMEQEAGVKRDATLAMGRPDLAQGVRQHVGMRYVPFGEGQGRELAKKASQELQDAAWSRLYPIVGQCDRDAAIVDADDGRPDGLEIEAVPAISASHVDDALSQVARPGNELCKGGRRQDIGIAIIVIRPVDLVSVMEFSKPVDVFLGSVEVPVVPGIWRLPVRAINIFDKGFCIRNGKNAPAGKLYFRIAVKIFSHERFYATDPEGELEFFAPVEIGMEYIYRHLAFWVRYPEAGKLADDVIAVLREGFRDVDKLGRHQFRVGMA